MLEALLHHWPEYLIEAALLGTFMLSACAAVAAVSHPASPIGRRVRSPLARRAIIGLAMGLTAVCLIYSPLGRQSGAHMNPATTLAFTFLGKVRGWDAVFYIAAQFIGGATGVALAAGALPCIVRHEAVNCVATAPGGTGRRAEVIAFLAELAMTFALLFIVLYTSNRAATAPYTGVIVGVIVALYITFEAPISGMSINPARTLGSALAARQWRAIWVYFTAPPLGMLAAAAVYAGIVGPGGVYCAKMDHSGNEACIFNCRIAEMPGRMAKPMPALGIEHAFAASARP